ncbi:MAG: ACT domain-containing protein [Clostridia bacterium]|nr:ACT domain-containing protein [Clostridia bacterium]MBP3706127.1 ACT domain-containing protein [Clostridia bacterium]
MYITQLSVFVENRVGNLDEILEVLSQNGINIRALSMADTSEFGILRMIVDDTDKAKEKLREIGVVVKSSEVIAQHIDDTPGGLQKVISKLKQGGVSVEYLYAFLNRENDTAQVVLRVDDTKKAEQLLK